MFSEEARNPGRNSIKIKHSVFKEGLISQLPNNITKDGTKQQKSSLRLGFRLSTKGGEMRKQIKSEVDSNTMASILKPY